MKSKLTEEIKKEYRQKLYELVPKKLSVLEEELWNFIDQSITKSIEAERERMELINGDKIENTWEAGLKEGRRQTKQGLIEEIKDFEQKVNQFDISSGAIDDNNSMLIELIGECRKLLENHK